MTKPIVSLIGLALLAVSASAQVMHKIEVNVPFSFVAAGKTWTAGTYKMDIRRDTGLVTLHSPDSDSKMLLTQAGQPPDNGNTRVRFQRYGNQWMLRAIFADGIQADVLPTTLERELISGKPADSRTLLARVRR